MASSRRPWKIQDQTPTPTTDSGDDGRWLAPDAKPATTAVLDVLEPGASMTAGELAAATGFTEASVERILGDLMAGGIVHEQFRGRRASSYRRLGE